MFEDYEMENDVLCISKPVIDVTRREFDNPNFPIEDPDLPLEDINELEFYDNDLHRFEYPEHLSFKCVTFLRVHPIGESGIQTIRNLIARATKSVWVEFDVNVDFGPEPLVFHPSVTKIHFSNCKVNIEGTGDLKKLKSLTVLKCEIQKRVAR